MKKRFPLFFLTLIVCLQTFGSINSSELSSKTVTLSNQQQNESWILLQQSNGVSVYCSYGICDESASVFIKLVNSNNYAVEASWNSAFKLPDANVDTDHQFQISIAANSELTGDCENNSLMLNAYKYVSTLKSGVCDYSIDNLKIEEQ